MNRFLLLLAIAGIALTASAQDSEIPSQKYSVATASFWSNWFVQADVTASSFYGDRGNAPGVHLSSAMLKPFRTNMGFSVALGKWVTPGLGRRTRFSGLWGRTVVSDDKDVNASKYWLLDEQLLFNLSNMFCGYSNTRRWSLIPYLSAGVGRNMSHNTYAMALGGGILNQWRLSPKASVNLDLSWTALEPDFDGAGGDLRPRGLRAKDQVLALAVGLTWNLGSGTFRRVEDNDALTVLAESQIDALNAQLADALAENDRLRQQLENIEPPKPPVVVHEAKAAPVSVFFNRGQATIASRRELQNVQELADMARDSSTAEFVVTGYADSATGSAEYNQQLSEQRAQAVAAELQHMGIAPERIKIMAGGGVDSLSPAPFNRRVVVRLEKYYAKE